MNVRQTLIGFIGGLTLAFATERAVAYPVTWEFAGEITSVVDRNNLLDGAITVGTPFSGSYTFESTTPDLDPKNTGNGRYDDAITSVSGVIGDLTFGGPIKGDNLIAVRDDFFVGGFDNYLANTRVDFFGEPMFFALELRDSTGGMFLDDSLPLSAPSLEGLDPTVTGFRITMKEDLGLFGDLTFLVPEPTTFLLISLGTFGLIRRRRRRSQPNLNPAGARKMRSRASVLASIAVALCSIHGLPAYGITDCQPNGIDDPCDIDCGPPGGPCDGPRSPYDLPWGENCSSFFPPNCVVACCNMRRTSAL